MAFARVPEQWRVLTWRAADKKPRGDGNAAGALGRPASAPAGKLVPRRTAPPRSGVPGEARARVRGPRRVRIVLTATPIDFPPPPSAKELSPTTAAVVAAAVARVAAAGRSRGGDCADTAAYAAAGAARVEALVRARAGGDPSLSDEQRCACHSRTRLALLACTLASMSDYLTRVLTPLTRASCCCAQA
jgi:hypothetical protein